MDCWTEWLALLIVISQEGWALLTWKGCRSRHFRVKTCVFIKGWLIMLRSWSSIGTVKDSICRLWGRNSPLFINYDTDCSAWDGWGRCCTIDQMSYFIDWRTHLIWMSWRQSIPRLHWLRRGERLFNLMDWILRAPNDSFLFFTTSSDCHGMSFVSWSILIIVSSQNHLACILGSSRLSKWTLPIYHILLLIMKGTVIPSRRVSLWRRYLIGRDHVILFDLRIIDNVIG